MTKGDGDMERKNEDLPVFLDAENIADTLRVSKRTAYYLMDKSDFPLIKIGRCKRVEREGFLLWLEKRTLNKN
jgi:hypothetical protein